MSDLHPARRRRLRTTLLLGLLSGALPLTATHADTGAAQEEAAQLGQALRQIDQSYQYQGLRSGHGSASVGGSAYRDQISARTGQSAQPSRHWRWLEPPLEH